ncbi:MAG: S-methyl-5-thioribose-1-phosphate isomerase [Thermoplasmatota archaeon]
MVTSRKPAIKGSDRESEGGPAPSAKVPAAVEAVARDIETMRVRGAGAIARAGAIALGSVSDPAAFEATFARLLQTRPTAVSLRNALEFVRIRAQGGVAPPGAVSALSMTAAKEAGVEFARRSEAAVAAIGRLGAERIRDGGRYLTHCNSQAAVAVFRAAHEQGKRFEVVATETRPFRQGLITVRNLRDAGIERVALAVDGAAFSLLAGMDAVVVGADTIAANGDVINKIGTSAVALAARERGLPFFVGAETYKVDLEARDGAVVPIEEREAVEVVAPSELPPGVRVLNPVFDVTPGRWVKEFFTESGPADARTIAALARKAWA